MNILAIDTSADILSLAIYRDGEVNQLNITAKQNQASVIYLYVEQLLKSVNLSLDQCDAIAFGKGPGSFTGVRISATFAQGLAIAKNIPVLPVSNLQALAYQARDYITAEDNAPLVLAAIDARMQEIYCGWYKFDGQKQLIQLDSEHLIAPNKLDFAQGAQKFIVIGNIDDYLSQMSLALSANCVQNISTNVQAKDIALIGADMFATQGGQAPEFAVPVYLRDAVIN